MVGKTISHYKITEKLGEGGMGEVYLADDTKLERQVAIKFLPEHLTKDKENVERFEREAKAAAALNHPNIVTIHEIAEEGDQTFIVMEYVEGDSLRTKIDEKNLIVEEVLNITKQICEGLSEAHKADIVHRDIKPENILIDNRGRIKILDFGLAKLKGVSKLTKETSTLGTIHYMSPEQLQGKEIDNRSDIWSLGVVFYELLTGEVPFKGEYEQALAYSILNEKPSLSNSLGTSIPLKLKHIANKAMAKNKNERYQHVYEMLLDLNKAEEELISRESRPSYKNAFQKSGKKLSVIYAGLAFLVVAIILMYVFIIQNPKNEIIDSIAVLPMQNISDNPDLDFLTDGMTEALISELAKIEALRVISRTSIMRYKKTDKSLPDIAKELNVDAILEGSALIFSDQIRITAQLIKAKTDEHIWVEQYDSDLKDVLALYSKVAIDIAKKIKIKLTPGDEERLAGAEEVDPEAYMLYIKGLKYRHLEGYGNYQRAVELFKQAVKKDPHFALAYARLALCYAILKGIYHLPGEEIVTKAREAVAKAIEQKDNLSEAYVALGLIQEFIDRDWVRAEQSFRQAIQLNPGSIEPHLELGLLLTRSGNNMEQAFAEFRLAMELDPVSVRATNAVTEAYLKNGDYDKVIELCGRGLEVEPDQRIVRFRLGWAYILKGNPKKAVIEFEKLLEVERDEIALWGAGVAYGVLGLKEKALNVRNELRVKWPDNQYIQAYIEAGLGNWEPLIHYFEQSWERNRKRPFFGLGSPFFDPMRSDSRFIALIEKMGIKE